LRGIKGPVWYLGLVLIFDTIYALAPFIKTYAAEFNTLQAFLWDIRACFLTRLLYPIGTTFTPLNLQLGYAPQYIAAYALGASLSSPTPPMTPTTRNALVTTSILSAATVISLLYLYPDSYTFDSLKGGPNFLAFCYAIWNETTGYLIGSALLDLFRRKRILNRRWANFAKYSYPAFLVHPIVCVGLQVWSDGWEAGGVLKTAVLGTAAVAGSWVLGTWVVLNVPWADAVLV
jgi:glucan biosynthesis protein C